MKTLVLLTATVLALVAPAGQGCASKVGDVNLAGLSSPDWREGSRQRGHHGRPEHRGRQETRDQSGTYRSMDRYGCRNYTPHASPHGRHSHNVAERLVVLRANVRGAVVNNSPRAAIGFLQEIIVLDRDDFRAFEFLSYSYAVLGDAASAADVDVDTVVYFDSVPEAQGEVGRACSRLSSWDPLGWRGRVAQRKAFLGRS
jgi:hypothetical protein